MALPLWRTGCQHSCRVADRRYLPSPDGAPPCTHALPPARRLRRVCLRPHAVCAVHAPRRRPDARAVCACQHAHPRQQRSLRRLCAVPGRWAGSCTAAARLHAAGTARLPWQTPSTKRHGSRHGGTLPRAVPSASGCCPRCCCHRQPTAHPSFPVPVWGVAAESWSPQAGTSLCGLLSSTVPPMSPKTYDQLIALLTAGPGEPSLPACRLPAAQPSGQAHRSCLLGTMLLLPRGA